MARQSNTPVAFNKSVRKDTVVLMSSGRAGVVQPIAFIPLHAGDSASGRVGIDIQLKEMPKPLLNGVWANFQAWFVPKSAHPQFPGRDELLHARTGAVIKSLGLADRAPPPFFATASGALLTTAAASDFFKKLGLHVPTGSTINTDLLDAFTVIYNFRLAAHSSRLVRRKYSQEVFADSVTLPPAFWPSPRFSKIVPDYERALIVGSLDLDVIAGRLPVSGIGFAGSPTAQTVGSSVRAVSAAYDYTSDASDAGTSAVGVVVRGVGASMSVARPEIFAEMASTVVSVTLADMDKARTTQAFAKLRAAYAGNDATGFDNDDTLIAHLMQGIAAEPDDFKRPWLLDSARVPVGFAERHATDGASLAQSVTLGRASASLKLNVPNQDVSDRAEAGGRSSCP